MAKNRVENAIVLACAVLCLTVLCFLFVRHVDLDLYNPDSWSYYEISKNVFTDFYRVNTVRQYQLAPEYSASFPPLWPFLIASLNAVAHIDWYAGYVLAFIASAATVFVLIRFSRTLFGQPILGPFLFALLLLDPFYRDELFGGRSIPLSVAVIFLLVTAMSGIRKSGYGRVALVAVLAGVAAMNRFDFLAAGLVGGIVATFAAGGSARTRLMRAAVYAGVFGLVISPWIAYSLLHFSSLFVTDNSRTALAAIQTFVTDYYDRPLPTVFDMPLVWLQRYSNSFIRLARIFAYMASFSLLPLFILAVFIITSVQQQGRPDKSLRAVWLAAPVFLALHFFMIFAGYVNGRYYAIIPAVLIGILAALAAKLRGLHWSAAFPLEGRAKEALGVLFLAAPLFLAQYITFALTGYAENRYVSTTVLFACAAAACFFSASLRRVSPLRTAAVLGLFVLMLTMTQHAMPEPRTLYWPTAIKMRPEEVLSCVTADARILVLDQRMLDPFSFGAITGAQTFVRPLNLTRRTAPQLIEHYGITYAVAGPGTFYLLEDRYILKSVCGKNVYQLTAL